MKKILLILPLCVLSMSAQACEQWKSEIAGTIKDFGVYIIAYNDFQNNEISKNEFVDKSNGVIAKLTKIKERVDGIPSCTDDVKFENRREKLLTALNVALPSIYAYEILSPSLKENLKND